MFHCLLYYEFIFLLVTLFGLLLSSFLFHYLFLFPIIYLFNWFYSMFNWKEPKTSNKYAYSTMYNIKTQALTNHSLCQNHINSMINHFLLNKIISLFMVIALNVIFYHSLLHMFFSLASSTIHSCFSFLTGRVFSLSFVDACLFLDFCRVEYPVTHSRPFCLSSIYDTLQVISSPTA